MATLHRGEACTLDDARGPAAALLSPPPPLAWRFVNEPSPDAHCAEDPADTRKQKKPTAPMRSRRRAKVARKTPTAHHPAWVAYDPEDDGLPCLELLLSDAFKPLPVSYRQVDPCPAPSDGDAVREPHEPQRRPVAHDRATTSRTRKRRERAAAGRKHVRVEPRPRADVAAGDLPAAKSDLSVAEGGIAAPPAAERLPVWTLPRRATTHRPLLRPTPPPIFPVYTHEAAASALATVCRVVGVDIADGAPLKDVLRALCSMPTALATGRRPCDPVTTEPVGWVALMGNHDWAPGAAAMPVLWAGSTLALAAVGLAVVAPTPDHPLTETERVMRVLAAEAHMPWFAARVRGVVDDTLGDGLFVQKSLFDAVPMDVFLVASIDAARATRPYDIYVVPRVDLLPP
ncbi:hypothetical protein psal_cds_666 [Pandoravirus salinus]|uniref:Uncharacterized protein n=1 Tax=Pandoravirus salinus TaxID=1349410 RepID=S4W2A7_9VIRU|nr:Atrophin-1 superfamily incomplete domain [Pandoravirus salinus]AGO84587.1 hypothetical protein psal_cds_666 [Pandoravirus salinus]